MSNPKVKVGQRLVTLGIYGSFNSVKTDFEQIAADLAASNYTGAVFHINSPWCQVPGHPRFPWPYDPVANRFNMLKDNEEYYTAFQLLLDVFEEHGLDLMVNFDDQYFTAKWVAMTRAKMHPYRKNNVQCQPDDEKFIYDSIELPAATFDWLAWKSISEPENKFIFSLVGNFGKARDRWITRCLQMIQAKRQASKKTKGPQQPGDETWRVLIRRANEEIARVDPATGNTSHALSLGDRSEIFAWLHDKMLALGMKSNNRNLFTVVNRNVAGGTDQDDYRHYTVLNRDITNTYGVHFGMGSLHEVHIDGAGERDNLIKFSQFRTNRTLWSNDGMPKQSGAQFTRDSRALYLKGDPFFDQLFEEGGLPGRPNMWGPNVKVGPPFETMKNWQAVWPFHKAIVK